jgi:hypothetical protein
MNFATQVFFCKECAYSCLFAHKLLNIYNSITPNLVNIFSQAVKQAAMLDSVQFRKELFL